MKKILIGFIALVLLSGFCFAEDVKAPATADNNDKAAQAVQKKEMNAQALPPKMKATPTKKTPVKKTVKKNAKKEEVKK